MIGLHTVINTYGIYLNSGQSAWIGLTQAVSIIPQQAGLQPQPKANHRWTQGSPAV